MSSSISHVHSWRGYLWFLMGPVGRRTTPPSALCGPGWQVRPTGASRGPAARRASQVFPMDVPHDGFSGVCPRAYLRDVWQAHLTRVLRRVPQASLAGASLPASAPTPQGGSGPRHHGVRKGRANPASLWLSSYLGPQVRQRGNSRTTRESQVKDSPETLTPDASGSHTCDRCGPPGKETRR